MKRNRIGDTDIDLNIPYWSGEKGTFQLRMSEIELYSCIDLLQEKANLSKDNSVIQDYYNQMDIYFTCIKLIENFGTSPDLLKRAGVVLNSYILNKSYAKIYDSLDKRNIFVNSLISKIIEQTTDFTFTEQIDNEFLIWYRKTVLEQNFYSNPVTGQKSIVNPVATIGETITYDYLSLGLKDSGSYWLYSQIDSTDFTPEADYKRAKQREYVDWLRTSNVGFSRSSINNNIQAGILKQTGLSPEENLKALQKEATKTPSVGFVIELIVAIIGAVVALAKLIIEIVAVCGGKDSTTGLLSPSTAMQQGTAPGLSDWYGYDSSTGQVSPTASSGTILGFSPLLIGAVILGAVLLFS